MREAEELMLNAEKVSSLAWLDGASYPGGALTEAWKKVLFNQFHDLAAGSGIGVIYEDAQRNYDVVRWTARDASMRAFHRIASEINTKASRRRSCDRLESSGVGTDGFGRNGRAAARSG